jgi:molecular chaperone DnaK (HSP70)
MLSGLRDWVGRRLGARRTEEWIACLDFGTSYSKMAMVLAEETEELEARDIRPLPIGQGTASPSPFLLPSVVFVSETGLLFGPKAETAAQRAAAAGRRALDAPKQYLSTDEAEALDGPLHRDVDPGGRYTPRQLITLYLAYLFLRAEKAAIASSFPWPVKLRIARPAWGAGRAQSGETALRNMVRLALDLADELEPSLAEDRELTHEEASAALARALAAAPQSGWDENVFWIGEDKSASVLEATAVAAGSIRQGRRRVVVVADIGGGTSDFAAFMTGLPGRRVVAEIAGSACVLREAGDHVDMLLRSFILNKAGLLADDPAARGAVASLRSRQRALKERLFEQGRLIVELGDDFLEFGVEEFLAFPPVIRFADRLRSTFEQALDPAIRAAAQFLPGGKMEIEIMLTGGGHVLPMVRALADQPGRDWTFRRAEPSIPGISGHPDFKGFVEQLAVAIGGAIRDLPVQTAPVRL